MAAAVLLAAGGCAKAPAEQAPVVTVQAATATRAAISSIVTVDAVLYPRSQAAIVPKITAPVERFYVQRGQRVRKGELLVVLEHRDLAGAAAQNLGMYQQAQANYVTTKQASVPADLQKAELDVTTTKQALDAQQTVYDDRAMLFKQGALPRRDLETAGVALAQGRSQYEVAKQHLEALKTFTQAATLKAAEAQLTAAKGQYEAAEAQLSYATIRSPIDGFVTDRPFYVGEMATAGTPLLTVMETTTVVARAPVPEEQASQIKVGDDATLAVPGLDGPVSGRVTVVSPALDPSSTTVQIWIEVPNADDRLKPGTSVRASIVTRTVSEALVVPAEALLTDASGARSVMVVGSDHKAHMRPVAVGIVQDGRAQIIKGLKSGETVVTTGAFGMDDGTEVRVQTASTGLPAPTGQ
ncbi:MAG TPA: efflux RND transporter periplasmic adaptor subunit [Vicinamibacterales bacterium]|nr:efflux RND transporter periplasmic adaptor subunit [Vicinamibacterales bacterium]